MRLTPIEKPKGLRMRMAFWFTRRKFGKVMTPMKVMFTRMPGAVKLSYEISKFDGRNPARTRTPFHGGGTRVANPRL